MAQIAGVPQSRRPELASQLKRALMLVAARKLTYSHRRKAWTVGSQSTTGARYVVSMGADGRTASCQCEGSMYGAPAGLCKHATEFLLSHNGAVARTKIALTGGGRTRRPALRATYSDYG